MRVLLASLLTASAVFGGAPVMALPALDELEIELQGEAQGWLNATCTITTLVGSVKSKADTHCAG